MIIFPAIDLLQGRCVRLTEGKFGSETVFSEEPAQVAAQWAEAGAEYLHVVDLDGALEGKRRNEAALREIIGAVNIPVQIGGGIRSLRDIEDALALGAARVILGSAAVTAPDLAQQACKLFPGKIVVGIDAVEDRVAIQGWTADTEVTPLALAKKMAAAGVERIIFTDISRDGKLSGVNAEATAALAEGSGLKVIASGGVATKEDLYRLKRYESHGIEGCIVGKAIYTGQLDLREIIKLAEEDCHAY